MILDVALGIVLGAVLLFGLIIVVAILVSLD